MSELENALLELGSDMLELENNILKLETAGIEQRQFYN